MLEVIYRSRALVLERELKAHPTLPASIAVPAVDFLRFFVARPAEEPLHQRARTNASLHGWLWHGESSGASDWERKTKDTHRGMHQRT